MSSKVFWRFCITGLMLGLVMIAPVIFLSFTYVSGLDLLVKTILMVLLVILILYLITSYWFGPLLSIISDEKRRLLDASKALVKGNFFKVLAILILTNFIFYTPDLIYTYYYSPDYMETVTQTYLPYLLNAVLFIFVTPFSYSATVILCLGLQKNKNAQ